MCVVKVQHSLSVNSPGVSDAAGFCKGSQSISGCGSSEVASEYFFSLSHWNTKTGEGQYSTVKNKY